MAEKSKSKPDGDDGMLDGEEVYRRMPALHLIDDVEVREETARLTAAAPDYFWEVPASVSGYHNPLCRGEHGLWAHTLMVSTVVERLAPSYVEQGEIPGGAVDLARSAAILHDQRKNGSPENPSDKSVQDHDLRMADVIEESDLPGPIVGVVETHMGPWYDGPMPSSELDHLVHNADMVASTASITPHIPEPVPDELRSLGAEGVDLA